MNPYDFDYRKFKNSREITDPKEILKYKLAAGFVTAIENMETQEVLDRTGLDKSDLSRLRAMGYKRFSIDRILGLLNSLGLSANISIVPINKVS